MAQLDLVGITTHDMAAALAFYRLLGLTFPEGAEQESHVEYQTPTGFRLALDTVELMASLHDGHWPTPVGHRMGLAFLCASPSEVDALHAKVVAAGHASQKAPWDAFWGQRYAIVADPDGNLIDLFAPL